MMKHILVPIGDTDSAKNSLQYAIDFAEQINAKVFVFRAYSGLNKAGAMININALLERETNLYIKTIIDSVDTKNVEVAMVAARGNVLDSVADVNNEIGIDLIIVGTKSNSIKEELYLGKTVGSLVKQTNIPLLAIPENYSFKPIKKMQLAFKSGVISQIEVIRPISFIKKAFNASLNLLLVKTPSFMDADGVIDPELSKLQDSFIESENGTTYQGVLEHLNAVSPDLLCVCTRKRGFFQKLLEKNTIQKSEFYVNIPLLVLKGA